MPTFADILRELAALLDADFELNRGRVAAELHQISKSIQPTGCYVEKENYKGIKYMCNEPIYAKGLCKKCYDNSRYTKKEDRGVTTKTVETNKVK